MVSSATADPNVVRKSFEKGFVDGRSGKAIEAALLTDSIEERKAMHE